MSGQNSRMGVGEALPVPNVCKWHVFCFAALGLLDPMMLPSRNAVPPSLGAQKSNKHFCFGRSREICWKSCSRNLGIKCARVVPWFFHGEGLQGFNLIGHVIVGYLLGGMPWQSQKWFGVSKNWLRLTLDPPPIWLDRKVSVEIVVLVSLMTVIGFLPWWCQSSWCFVACAPGNHCQISSLLVIVYIDSSGFVISIATTIIWQWCVQLQWDVMVMLQGLVSDTYCLPFSNGNLEPCWAMSVAWFLLIAQREGGGQMSFPWCCFRNFVLGGFFRMFWLVPILPQTCLTAVTVPSTCDTPRQILDKSQAWMTMPPWRLFNHQHGIDLQWRSHCQKMALEFAWICRFPRRSEGPRGSETPSSNHIEERTFFQSPGSKPC